MKTLILLSVLIALPAAAQTMYKCPNAAGTVNFQQMPCTPTGGGEAVTVKKIPAGTGSGLSDSARNYLENQTAERGERNRQAEEEARRQEAVRIERGKVRAAEEQAAAQRATAAAIWATGFRH